MRNALLKRRSPKRKPKPNSQNSNHSSLHPRGFAKQTSRTRGVPEWVASTLSSIAKHMLESSTIGREAVAQSLLGLMVPDPRPAPPHAQQNGVLNHIIDMCDVASRGNKHEGCWPQNTNKVRLRTTELWDLIVSVLGNVSRVSDRSGKPDSDVYKHQKPHQNRCDGRHRCCSLLRPVLS